MLNLRAMCAAALLFCASTTVFADAASHAAAAANFLKVTHADQIATPFYMQAQQAFTQRFAELKAPDSKKAVLEAYQAKADAALNKVVAWDLLKPEMVKLYVSNFSESELKELTAFYQTPTGSKMMKVMPKVYSESMQMTQGKLPSVVPVIEKLLTDMTAELTPKKP